MTKPISPREMEQIVQSIDFRPFGTRYNLKFLPAGVGGIDCSVVITADVPDSAAYYNGEEDQLITSGFSITLHPFMGREGVIRTIHRYLIEAVTHEANEFFLLEGKPIFYPHREPPKTAWETRDYSVVTAGDLEAL